MVKMIFDCVLLLRQRKIKPVKMIEVNGILQFDVSDSYASCAKPMMTPSFVTDLLTYPKEKKMNDEMVELLYPYIERCARLGARRALLDLHVCSCTSHIKH